MTRPGLPKKAGYATNAANYSENVMDKCNLRTGPAEQQKGAEQSHCNMKCAG
jgi:hypothetical protein